MDVVVMPQLGETVVEGTITSWAKSVGDPVAVDETLFEVSTEKVDTEVPSAVAGFLRLVLVEEGDAVPIGTAVAVITATADEPFDPPGASGAPDASPAPAEPPTPDPPPSAANRRRFAAKGGDAVVSPVVRRLLDEHGLALEQVVGSGRDGRVTRSDVLAAAANRRPATDPSHPSNPSNPANPPNRIDPGPDDDVVPLSRARLATALHLHRSVATAAHALVVVEVDWSAVDAARRDRRLSYLPFVARAAIDALTTHPHLNASFDGDRLIVHRRVHLGIAVDVDQEALLVPVIHDADALRLPALAEAVADRADQARRHRLPGDAFDGGTFTLTNVGSYGTVLAAPIINQPQVAILSTDGIRMRPAAVDDGHGGLAVGIRPLGNLSLSFDHRAVDGAYAAAFLAEVRGILQDRDWSAEVAA